MTTKKPQHHNIEELVRDLVEANIDEHLTALFEEENGVDFSVQTPDEIAYKILNNIGFKYNE